MSFAEKIKQKAKTVYEIQHFPDDYAQTWVPVRHVLAVYAEDQKERKQKLQQWLKELDAIFNEGYSWNFEDNALETLHKVRESKEKFEELLK